MKPQDTKIARGAKSRSPVLVSISVFTFAGFLSASAFAQVVISCSQGISIGKNAQCSGTAKLVINPDSSTNLASGCVIVVTPPKAAKCVVKTGGAPPTKSVRVDFAKTFVNINNGGKQVRIDDFKMQYKTTVPAASKFTFTPTAVSNTITLNIGATMNVTPSQGLGTYSGNITIRANPI